MKRNLIYFGSIVFAALTLSVAFACDNDDDRYKMPDDVQWRSSGKAAGTIVTTPYDQHLEVPARKSSNQFVAHTVEINNREVMNFCLEFDPVRMHSRWVAFRFDGDTRTKSVARGDEPFTDDPKLPNSMWVGSSSFGWPYSRGHLVASADRLFLRLANDQTFYMSNMSPQLYDFNGGYWATLEQGIQKWARSKTNGEYKYKNIYVCKGGTIKSNQIKTSFNTYNVLGRSVKVPVPAYYFMAILAETRSGSFQAVGFLMEHKNYTDDGGTNYSSSNYPPSTLMKQHAMSIDQLEDFTGINFFCNLSDAIEEVVESSYASTQWDWNWK